MNVTCDHCDRTARGLLDDLIDAGWSRVIIRAPFRRTFTACPDHGRDMSLAVIGALTGGDEPEIKRIAELWDAKRAAADVIGAADGRILKEEAI